MKRIVTEFYIMVTVMETIWIMLILNISLSTIGVGIIIQILSFSCK